MSLVKLFFIFLFALNLSSAFADILIEPVIGHSSGSFNSKIDVPLDPTLNETTKDSIKGLSYGGRLGLEYGPFQFGGDYLATNFSMGKDDFKTSELGAFVGFKLPLFMRAYAGYILAANGAIAATSETPEIKMTGNGMKFGVGFSLLYWLQLLVEYRTVDYEKEKNISGVMDIDGDYRALMIGLSFPISF